MKGFAETTELFLAASGERVSAAAAAVEARVRAGGLLAPGAPLLVLLSGGRDSVCLLDLAVRIGCEAAALHVDHGLRADSHEDAAFCARLCARLDVDLTVRELREAPTGNVQAWARERRYSAAHGLAEPRGAAIATGHTATDQVETVLYRLAASPGAARCSGSSRGRARSCGRCSRSRARRRRPTAPSAGCPSATTRATTPTPTPATACAPSCCPRCGGCTPRPTPTSCARSRCCATRPRCSTPPSTPR